MSGPRKLEKEILLEGLVSEPYLSAPTKLPRAQSPGGFAGKLQNPETQKAQSYSFRLISTCAIFALLPSVDFKS